MLLSVYLYPTPLVSKNHLAQEPTPGSAVKFSHHFFYQGSGFFMFLVDVGQLFRCAGHHFMCVTTGPPIRGDPISHSQAHIPLKPLPPALDPFPGPRRKFFFRGTGLPTAVRKNQPLVPRSNLGGKVCARTDPWFRGQTLLVPGHGGGGYIFGHLYTLVTFGVAVRTAHDIYYVIFGAGPSNCLSGHGVTVETERL